MANIALPRSDHASTTVESLVAAVALPTAVVPRDGWPDQPVIAMNRAMADLLGVAEGSRPPTPAEVLRADDEAPGGSRSTCPHPPVEGTAPLRDVTVRRRDGITVPVVASLSLVNADGAPAVLVQLVDRRPVVAAEAAREHLRERFHLTFDLAPVGMAVGGAELVVREVNDALSRFLRRPPSAIVGRRVADLVNPDDPEAEHRRLTELVEGGGGHHRRRSRHVLPDGDVVWADVTLAVVHGPPGPSGRTGQFVAHVVDVTDAHRRELELHQHSREDPLTHLLNRRALTEAYSDLRSREGSGKDLVAVLFCDLARFKDVNDSAGHHVGDELLRLVARRIGHAVRPQDRLARLGGDEFVLLCRVGSPSDALAFARRVVRCFDQPFQVGDESFHLGVNVGVDVGGPGTGLAQQLAAADAAMYRAKRAGEPIALSPDCGMN